MAQGGRIVAFSDRSKSRAWIRQRASGHTMNSICARCGKQLIWFFENKEVEGGWCTHHIKPVEKGGNNRWQNCVILCNTSPNCYLILGSHGSLDKHEEVLKSDFPFFNGGQH